MNPYGPQQLANAIRIVRKNTILVAEDIPEESYGYRVTPDSRSVAETLLHIASAPQIDYHIHGSERISSIEDFQLFGTILKEAPIMNSCRTQRHRSSICSAPTARSGRTSWRASHSRRPTSS